MNSRFYQYTRTFEGLNKLPPDVDRSKNLSAWQKRAGVTRAAWQTVKEEHEKEIAEILATYSPAVAAEKRKDADAAFDEITKIARERMVEGLEEVLASKRKAFDKANDAPDDAAVRLLSVLALRTSIPADEIASVVPKFNGNLPALRALADLAAKSGVNFPHVLTAQEFDERMEKARDFAMQRINNMDKDEYNSYTDLSFWKYADNRGPSTIAFAPLDECRFTVELKQPQPEIETEENADEQTV